MFFTEQDQISRSRSDQKSGWAENRLAPSTLSKYFVYIKHVLLLQKVSKMAKITTTKIVPKIVVKNSNLSPVKRGDIVLNFSVSVRLSHPWRGPLRHVCGHTNHRTTMIHTFLESPSDLDVYGGIRFGYSKTFCQNWCPKMHYMALSSSRRGPFRHVCG